jgi:hypothetical protein
VKVVGEHNERIEPPAEARDGAFEAGEKAFAVEIIRDDVLAPIAACHHVVEGTSVLDA